MGDFGELITPLPNPRPNGARERGKMNKYEITKRIEEFAPLETQEDWDCSGWAVNVEGHNQINKLMLCLTVTNDVVRQAKELGADCLVTGDLKFHTALESPIVIYDIGHFESEILILPVFEKIIGNDAKIVYADEHSPFELI